MAVIAVIIPSRVFIVAAVSPVPVTNLNILGVVTFSISNLPSWFWTGIRIRIQTLTGTTVVVPTHFSIEAAVSSVPVTLGYVVEIIAETIVHQSSVWAAFIFWVQAFAAGAIPVPFRNIPRIATAVSPIPTTCFMV